MLLTVKKKIREISAVFSLIFEKPPNFSFYAGQYLDVELPVDDPNGNTRAFTISSSPTEDFLMISPKKGISPFKKFMKNLKPGDTINVSHPAGTFILDESSSAVFIAGGIGITPFRSIIKYAVDQKLKTPITLIYTNSDDDFPFRKELGDWKQTLPNFTIFYHNSTKNGRLTKLYPIPYFSEGKASSAYTLYPIFYLAGGHSFVNDVAKILIDSGVDETNIRYDRFDGYD